MTNINLINTIVSFGDAVEKDVYMVECGCAVNNNELEVCATHCHLSNEEINADIMLSCNKYGTSETQPQVAVDVATEEDATPLEKMKVKQLLKVADRLGLTFPARTLKKDIYKAIVDAQQQPVDTQEEDEPVEEPTPLDVDYGEVVSGYAEELIKLSYADMTPKQFANNVRLNATAILKVQQHAGTELTENQKRAMAHHKLSESGLNSMLCAIDMNHLHTMDGIDLFMLGVKLGMKPDLPTIESLRTELITLCEKAHSLASEASRANGVSATHSFKSARTVKIYRNAVQFVADGVEYAFVITPEGKHVLRNLTSKSSSYMKVNYLKKMLFEINTSASRALVRALTQLVKAQSPVGGGAQSPKEKNSTATREQDTMTLSYEGAKHVISKSWYQQFVNHAKQRGHKGSFRVADIVTAWINR